MEGFGPLRQEMTGGGGDNSRRKTVGVVTTFQKTLMAITVEHA